MLSRATRAFCCAAAARSSAEGAFGPTNVELHRLSVALDLGDLVYVVERGPAMPVDHVPAERRVSHLIDLSRAMSLTAGDDDALSNLLSAEQQAPQLVRHKPGVRETVRTMQRQAPATGGRSSVLLGLAERCRAVE